MSDVCPVCYRKAHRSSSDPLNMTTIVLCDNCGSFIVSEQAEGEMNHDEVATWLYYHKKYDKAKGRYSSHYVVTVKDRSDKDQNNVTLNAISNWYPKRFSEKVDKFLVMLYEKSECLGDKLEFPLADSVSACFAKLYIDDSTRTITQKSIEQCRIFIKYLVSEEYLTEDSSIYHVALSPKGLQRVDELQRYNKNNRDVFIAMTFPDEDDETDDLLCIKESIKSGITDAQHNAKIMCDMIHGKQIIPMMFRLIRDSKLLVMDVTFPNYGAYHESGYAIGIGKEVIITCREKEFNDPDNKPHFDIAQKQILVWKDYEDLTIRLSEWIKAIAE